MLKVDLHLHTAEDPIDNIAHDARTLVDRAADQGFDAIAITLHDRQLRDGHLTDYAQDRGILLIPGLEKTVAGRHVLLLNFPAAAERAASLDDIARLKRRSAGLVVAPHPFFPDASCLGRMLDRHADLFDAVEWSYFWTWGVNFNARAARWARAHGTPLVGNSDLHDLRQLGRTYSLVDAEERSSEAICAAIRAGRVSLCTSPVPPPELASVVGRMLLRGRRAQPAATVEGALGA